MLGLQGLLTNPGASLGVSIGNMELAIDYLSNIDAYEPDLTEVKTNISKKTAKRITKKPVIKPKLSREGIINKYSLVHTSVEISDNALDNSSIIQDADDFDFSFENENTDTNTEIPIVQNKEHTREIIDSLSHSEDSEEMGSMGDEEFELNSDFEIEGLDDFEDNSEFDEDDEDISIDFDIDSMISEDDEEESDEINIDMSGLSIDEVEDDEEEIDIDLSLIDEEEDEEEDTELNFDIDLDSMIDDSDDDIEEQRIGTNIQENKEVRLVDKKDNQIERVNQQKVNIDNPDKSYSETTVELQRQLDEKRKQNELLRQLAEEDAIHSRIVAEANKADAKAKTPKTEVKKENLSTEKPVNQVEVTASKYDKYTVMNIDALYACVKQFMYSRGVQKKLLDVKILNEEFGANNIQNLIVKQYLIKTNKGVTVGK